MLCVSIYAATVSKRLCAAQPLHLDLYTRGMWLIKYQPHFFSNHTHWAQSCPGQITYRSRSLQLSVQQSTVQGFRFSCLYHVSLQAELTASVNMCLDVCVRGVNARDDLDCSQSHKSHCCTGKLGWPAGSWMLQMNKGSESVYRQLNLSSCWCQQRTRQERRFDHLKCLELWHGVISTGI